MADLMEVLERRGYRLSEAELADAVDALLPDRTVSHQLVLSKADEEHLERHSGAVPATADQSDALARRRATDATVEVAQALTPAEVAALLHISTSRVSHRHAGGQLYAFRSGARRKLFPDWQFAGASALPHLPALIAALDPSSPPPLVRRFMLTDHPDLVLDGTTVSPRQWLLAGADPAPVIDLAVTLGDQP